MAADGSYCVGMMRSLHPKAAGGVDPAAELKKMMGKYFNGSIWAVSKVTLSKEKTEYIGAPHNVCIDLRKTKNRSGFAKHLERPSSACVTGRLEDDYNPSESATGRHHSVDQ